VNALVSVLADAGFVEEDESFGPMNSYQALMRHEDLTLGIVGDRGQWWIKVDAPSPRPGQGRAGRLSAAVEEYMAALRGDAGTDALFEPLPVRAEKAASWLTNDVAVLLGSYRDSIVWERVKALQRARSKRMFGDG
jgi:hypothetical protein